MHAELVASLALAGQHAEALAAYQAVRDRLDSELGIDPSPALRLAYEQIRATTEPPPDPRVALQSLEGRAYEQSPHLMASMAAMATPTERPRRDDYVD